MLKKIGIMLAILVFTISAIEAEDLPKANVEVTAEFVSNYVFRGADILGSSLASQKGLKQDGKIQAWAFQPNITFLTPVEGLTFGIWGSFATRNRRDTDSDQVIQQGPGGSEVEFHPALDLISGIDATSINSTTGAVSMHTPECVDNSNCIPGFYKEQNGLSRSDEIDYSLEYSRETNVGTLTFGLAYYTYPNIKAKGDAEEEVYIGYALPFLPQLSFTAYTMANSGGSSNQYFLLAYEDDVSIVPETVALTYGVSAGYGVKNHLQGFQDVNGSIGIEVSGFHVNLNVTHRPDTRFVDEDSGIGGDSLPLYLFGQSTRADGLITDQSQNTGLANAWKKSQIQAAIDVPIGTGVYTYTPRQKIPKQIYWISMGYTYSI